MKRQLEVLEIATGPVELVVGHNDLLAANILDDGDQLWLIDWEYGGFNTPLFDLAGLAGIMVYLFFRTANVRAIF